MTKKLMMRRRSYRKSSKNSERMEREGQLALKEGQDGIQSFKDEVDELHRQGKHVRDRIDISSGSGRLLNYMLSDIEQSKM